MIVKILCQIGSIASTLDEFSVKCYELKIGGVN